MDARQSRDCCPFGLAVGFGDSVLIPRAGQTVVALPSIRMDHAPWLDNLGDKSVERGMGGVGDAGHTDAARTGSILLDRDGHQRFAQRSVSRTARLLSAHHRLVHLHASAQPVSPGPDHCPS